jgi:hypothetical protein
VDRFWKISPWLVRVILTPPTLIFGMIASRYLFHPVQAATAAGISFVTPLGTTIARVGFGAFPLACALFTLSCLLSSRRLLTGLGFVATVMSAALVVRVFGMLADGTTRENMHLVIAELVSLVLMLVGVVLEMGRRRNLRDSAA